MSDNPYLLATDWQVDWWHDTDGDTVRARRSRTVQVADGLIARYYDDPDQLPKGLPIRVINLDTPERGDPRYAQELIDANSWLEEAGDRLMVSTWGTQGGFDRLLGDFWIDGDRNNTLTSHMLQLGYDPYVEGQ